MEAFLIFWLFCTAFLMFFFAISAWFELGDNDNNKAKRHALVFFFAWLWPVALVVAAIYGLGRLLLLAKDALMDPIGLFK